MGAKSLQMLTKLVTEIPTSAKRDQQRLESAIDDVLNDCTMEDRERAITGATIYLTNPIGMGLDESPGPWITATVKRPFSFVEVPQGYSDHAYVVIDLGREQVAATFECSLGYMAGELEELGWCQPHPERNTVLTTMKKAKRVRPPVR